MSEKEVKTEDLGKIDSMPMTIHAQYIKDLSFENPGAPETLKNHGKPAKTSVEFAMEAGKLDDEEDGTYEVVLSVTAQTRVEDKVVFITEVAYGSVVSVAADMPKEQRHPLLLIEIPRLSFPFVRQIVNDLAIQGGYPPMLINPVNFHQLYMDRFAKKQQELEAKEAS